MHRQRLLFIERLAIEGRALIGLSAVSLSSYMANTFQGHFPEKNTAADGYVGTSPVGSNKCRAEALKPGRVKSTAFSQPSARE